jgi:hypothetical protein
MRDDLLDAQASVDWAVAQIPVLQKRFMAWMWSGPYESVVEPDPQTGCDLVIIRRTRAADLSFNAEAGIIIHAIKSALDMVAAALAKRNGKKPSADTHFPIFRSHQESFDPLTGIEGKKWLSKAEIATIKAFKPYEGGDEFLFPFHHLDNMRKHERLIEIVPIIQSFVTSGWEGETIGGTPVWEGSKDKAVLFRGRPGARLRVTKSNPNITYAITLNEAAGLLGKKPVFPILRAYAGRVRKSLRSSTSEASALSRPSVVGARVC